MSASETQRERERSIERSVWFGWHVGVGCRTKSLPPPRRPSRETSSIACKCRSAFAQVHTGLIELRVPGAHVIFKTQTRTFDDDHAPFSARSQIILVARRVMRRLIFMEKIPRTASTHTRVRARVRPHTLCQVHFAFIARTRAGVQHANRHYVAGENAIKATYFRRPLRRPPNRSGDYS